MHETFMQEADEVNDKQSSKFQSINHRIRIAIHRIIIGIKIIFLILKSRLG